MPSAESRVKGDLQKWLYFLKDNVQIKMERRDENVLSKLWRKG